MTAPHPKNNGRCPYLDDEEFDGDCPACQYYIFSRENSSKKHHVLGFICELDEMEPDVYLTEPEPVMPWE